MCEFRLSCALVVGQGRRHSSVAPRRLGSRLGTQVLPGVHIRILDLRNLSHRVPPALDDRRGRHRSDRVSLALGLASGMSPERVVRAIDKGVGDILAGVAVILALGAMLGRMLDAGAEVNGRLARGWELATGRPADAGDLSPLLALYVQARERFTADPKASAALAASPDLAALTVVANALLNLDAVLTR